MADKSPLAYLPETSKEAIEANRNYQEALQRLNASLDQRKNRFFDPRFMAAAQAFLTPAKTGSFFESLGTAAGAVGKAQEGLLQEEQEIAKLNLDIAGQGLALQRQRELDRMYEQAMGGGKPAAPAAPGALPEAGAPTGGALPGGAPSGEAAGPTRLAGVPLEPQGIQIAPARAGLITRDQYLASARAAGTPLAEALKNWEEIQRKRREFRDGVVFDEETGRTFSAPKADLVERQFPTSEGFQMFKVDSITAAEYDDAIRRGDRTAIARIVERVIPSEGRTPSEGGGAAVSGRPLSVDEREAQRKQSEAYGVELGKTAAEQEAALKDTDAAARRIFGSSSRVSNILQKSPNYFGIFARPGVVAAIGDLVSKGIQTPAGTLNLAGFEDSVRKLMPGIKQKDLDNVTRAAGELAEIELAYTQLYLARQGAITEGERAIVRRLGGDTSNSPGVLKSRMDLLQARSQYDIDRIDAFKQWKEKNPRKNIMDFENTSLSRDLKEQFERRLATMLDGLPAIPSRKKQATQAPAEGSLSERLDKILGGR